MEAATFANVYHAAAPRRKRSSKRQAVCGRTQAAGRCSVDEHRFARGVSHRRTVIRYEALRPCTFIDAAAVRPSAVNIATTATGAAVFSLPTVVRARSSLGIQVEQPAQNE